VVEEDPANNAAVNEEADTSDADSGWPLGSETLPGPGETVDLTGFVGGNLASAATQLNLKKTASSGNASQYANSYLYVFDDEGSGTLDGVSCSGPGYSLYGVSVGIAYSEAINALAGAGFIASPSAYDTDGDGIDDSYSLTSADGAFFKLEVSGGSFVASYEFYASMGF